MQPRDPHSPEVMSEGAEPPPPGVKWMAALRWAFLAIAAGVALFAWGTYVGERRHAPGGSSAATVLYHCPMHPQIIRTEPGECPICHMRLEPIGADHAAVPTPPARPATPPSPGETPPGTTPIVLSLDRVQAIGVRTALVEEAEADDKLRVTAVVEPAERGAAEVHVRSPGFVEKIMVDQTGIAVAPGQPLFALYSPEILQAQGELAVAATWAANDERASTAEAARRKLELLGMSPEEIDAVARSKQPIRTITIHAPAGGYVVKKNVVLGSYVVPDTALYEIQDLSRVYVVADVFQRDVADLHKGDTGTFAPTLRPDAAVQARVDLVYPTLNAEARTTRVRMVVANPKAAPFRPGDYGTVEFVGRRRKLLSVPKDAVIDTGLSTYVFIAEGEGKFSPVDVVLGPDLGQRVSIAAGIRAGQQVVSGATFLVDSESRLQAAAAARSGTRK